MKKRKSNLIEQDEILAQIDIDESTRSYLYRILLGDYKSSMAYAKLHDSNLDLTRSQILRGDLNEIQIENQESDPEAQFEQARVHCFSGEFAKVEEISSQLIAKKNISDLTLMTSYQLRALSYFEQGKYSESLRDIEKALNFEAQFPHSEASLFLRQTLIRIHIMLHSIPQALQELFLLRSKIFNKTFNVNIRLQLMTYLRLICFIKRSLSQSDLIYDALAGLWLARVAGSRIYEGLFQLELAYCQTDHFTEFATHDLKKFFSEYSLVRYYEQKMKNHPLQISSPFNFDLYAQPMSHLVLLELNSKTDEACLELMNLKLSEQNKTILNTLKSGNTTKEQIFSLFNKGEYHPLENDAAIRKSLQRLSQQLGLSLKSKNGTITLPPGTLIADGRISL